MQKVKLICVGSLKEKFWKDAVEEYKKRLSRFCNLEIVEVAELSKLPIEQKIVQESESLFAQTKGKLLIFDRDGKDLSSEDFAKLLKDWQNESVISLVIGGSNGVSQKLKTSANALVCFGKATFPHQLFRVMAVEQLYRAFSIVAGSPYHK